MCQTGEGLWTANFPKKYRPLESRVTQLQVSIPRPKHVLGSGFCEGDKLPIHKKKLLYACSQCSAKKEQWAVGIQNPHEKVRNSPKGWTHQISHASVLMISLSHVVSYHQTVTSRYHSHREKKSAISQVLHCLLWTLLSPHKVRLPHAEWDLHFWKFKLTLP